VNTKTAAISEAYWSKRGGKPQPRPRHALSPAEENAYLVKGSRLCNKRNFYEGHDEWEEVWRRASGPRRRMLHGLIQVAVGYEHHRRGNPKGMRSLLRQGAAKLSRFTRRPGVRELRARALQDADSEFERVVPPKLMLNISGHTATAPKDAIRIEVPAR
jgi:hypothetical protein